MLQSRPLVVFTDDSIHPDAAAVLSDRYTVKILPGAYPSEETMIDACRDASAILARLGTVTRKVIAAAPKLRIIARHGIGVDAVDLDAATGRGIVVTTTGSINAAAVAEYTFAMLLGLARRIPQADAEVRQGGWSRGPLVGPQLAGKTLGILGLGAVGSHVARLALGFGMRVVACDPFARPPQHLDVEMVAREDLLARADFVTIHMRATPETHHYMNRDAFAAMKPGAVVLNTSRGELVDEDALADALESGHLGGAALDVFEVEPLPGDSRLRRCPNVLLSPHVAGQAREVVRLVGITAAEAIVAELSGHRPLNIYNPAAYEARQKAV
jgi:D-3-phosphoglycerate dehydrogenase